MVLNPGMCEEQNKLYPLSYGHSIKKANKLLCEGLN